MTAAKSKPGPSTKAVHAGVKPDETGAVMTPIYASSTYAWPSLDAPPEWQYARVGNPTRAAFERAMAELEGGTRGFAFASGLAAEAAILELLEQGSHIVATDDIYGGTWRLFERVRSRSAGLSVSYAHPGDVEAIRAAVTPATRMIWLETPTNPLLKIADLAGAAALGKELGVLTVVDSTFASPHIQRPLEFGVDIVVHSATKYLNGHSDMVGGVVVVKDDELARRIRFLQNTLGGILDPFPSFLASRGLKTLALRMDRHSANGLAVARWLQGRDKVGRVIYPGLDSHPQHALAREQMNGFGGIVSLEIDADAAGVRRFLDGLQLFTLAESLGGVESLIAYPVAMSHASMPPRRREELGVSERLLRLSLGIEDAADLTADLARALDRI
jgi:cystathionine gamma-lyase